MYDTKNLVCIDPKSMLEDGHAKKIKQHLERRLAERVNADVTRADLQYFSNILKESDTRTYFISSRKEVVMKYIPKSEGEMKKHNDRNTVIFLIDFKRKLLCLVFEDFILKTIYRGEDKLHFVKSWNDRSTKRKFKFTIKKETPADYIQRKIDTSEKLTFRRIKTIDKS